MTTMAGTMNGVLENLAVNLIQVTYHVTEDVEVNPESYEEKFIKHCIKYADAHGIGTLRPEILQNCFAIPEHGVWVDHPFFHDLYHAQLYPYCSRTELESLMGTYCYCDGVVAFVYRDGRTYVTKGTGIISELKGAGYREAGFYVPFCRGEVIRDIHLRVIWESIVEY